MDFKKLKKILVSPKISTKLAHAIKVDATL